MGEPRAYTETYELWTPEDIEHGESGERGFADGSWHYPMRDRDGECPWQEPGYLPEPTVVEADFDDSYARAMAEVLIYMGATEESSTPYDPQVWYSTPDAYHTNYATGEIEHRSVHLKGDWTPAERLRIWLLVCRQRHN